MELVVFIVALGIFVLVELNYYRKHALEDLDLKVRFSKPVANCGETIEVIETAENNKKLPLPFLILKFETPTSLEFLDMTNTSLSDYLYREDMLTMKPFARHTRKIKAKCTKRGYYSFTRVNISTTDLLLMQKLNREFSNDANITVLPARVPAESLQTLLAITFSETMRRRTRLTDPFSFAGIREYMPGDPMKSINWVATARSNDFMVNQNASTATRRVSIFLNLDTYNPKKSKSLLEYSISLAYSYICELGAMGIPASLFTNGIDILTGTQVISNADITGDDTMRCGTELARIDLGCKTASFDALAEEYIVRDPNDEFIVVISPRFDDEFKETMKKIKRTKDSSMWVMPAYKMTPQAELDDTLVHSYLRLEVPGRD